jgi:hypothetical protein
VGSVVCAILQIEGCHNLEAKMKQTLLKTALALGIWVTASTVAYATDRIRLVNVHGYQVIDNEHLILNGGASRHYLVTLRQRCIGMRFGSSIGTSFAATATVYSPRHEYVYTSDDIRCYIDTIEVVENSDAARALIAERAETQTTGTTE